MCDNCNPRFMAFMRAYGGRRDTLRRIGAGMLFTGLPGLSGAGALAKAVPVTPAAAAAGPADTIFLARRFHTMSARRQKAQAVAVRGGRIAAVGSRTEVMGLKGSGTQVIDLGDLTVLPGFIDPHMHSNF